MIGDQIAWINPSEIVVDRPKRQRQAGLSLDEGFVNSIRKGIINPLIIRATEPPQLVAGERRLEAAKLLAFPTVPCRYMETLSALELAEVELDENLRRHNLVWQDEVCAVERLHQMYVSSGVEWSVEKTAERIGMSGGNIHKMLRVARTIDDPKVQSCPGYGSAYEMLSRRDSRAIDTAMGEILEAGEEVDHEGTALPLPQPSTLAPASAKPSTPATGKIILASFLEWAPTYSGPKFNFIHCDFPYGINAFSGGPNRQHSEVGYDDSPDVYWELLSCLCKHLDNFMAPSAHLMFWFSMAHYTSTLDYLRANAPSLVVDPFPLMWWKTCNTGMVPDPNRQPRRVYETALFASREDRKIIRPIANAYGAPVSSKRLHPSEKPIPVLKHFFQMFVDDTSKVLDPTCGSGSALEAAECMGAKVCLGLEKDKEHWQNASNSLTQSRSMRRLGWP